MRGFMTVLLFSAFLKKTDSSITCDAPAVERGSPANITCHFDKDIGRTRKPFGIDRYHAGIPQVVLRCHWSNESEVPICSQTEGYNFSSTVTNTPTLHVSSTTEDFVGPYLCQELASNETFESCNLRLKQDANDTTVTCDAPVVKTGSPANITCHFESDISRTRTPFGIDKYATEHPQAVLRCHWSNKSETPICTHADGYLLNPMISNNLTLIVSSTTKDFVGSYACQVLTSHEKSVSCSLTLKTEDDDESDANHKVTRTAALVIGLVLSCVALIPLICLLIFSCRHPQAHQRMRDLTDDNALNLTSTSEDIKK